MTINTRFALLLTALLAPACAEDHLQASQDMARAADMTPRGDLVGLSSLTFNRSTTNPDKGEVPFNADNYTVLVFDASNNGLKEASIALCGLRQTGKVTSDAFKNVDLWNGDLRIGGGVLNVQTGLWEFPKAHSSFIVPAGQHRTWRVAVTIDGRGQGGNGFDFSLELITLDDGGAVIGLPIKGSQFTIQ